MTQTIIVIIYLVLLLGLGYLSGRLFRGNSNDFFVASRSIGPVVLFMSIFGTTMTAFAMVGSTGESFRVGVATYGKIASSSALIHSACFFMVGLPLWALGKRNGFHTQIEFFRSRFESRKIGYLLFPILVGLIIPYLLVGLMGAGSVMQGVTRGAFPDLFSSTGGAVPPWLTALVISCVVLYYIFAGGVRSAAWANTFQTVVFIIMGFIAFVTISSKLGGMQVASSMIDTAKTVRSGNITELQFFSYCLIPLSVGMFPHLFQNCLTAKSARSFKLTLIAHPLAIMLTWIPCILIGLWATGAVMPDGGTPVIPEGASPNAVLGMMVGKLTTPIIGGLVTAGILAAVMSSLDSQFVAVGTMFTKDIVVHGFGADRFSEKQLVMLARGFICFIVLVTYLFTLVEPRQVFSLGIWCFSGFAGLFPLVFASIYWKRATKAGAYAGVIGGALMWLVLFQASGFGADKEYSIGGTMPVVPIFFTCAIALVVVSLFTSAPSQTTLDKFFTKKS
ncbi:MAG: sodium:solute symporter family protein [Opitutales bacterium]|jgi:solute:Na+ symporter, SSS family|nr:sodium:solute symporter family protein [Opitutales bacterium]MBT5170500.1 sodium:solute symporter family protein [Opitutales bacterium]MBT5816359.1 sodium:solute symporter family protein [Opitutales bacterium]MBT6770754.1 sodium:solute symporter family protein [Opitutales bacterium]MDG2255077.1 sodium:solute symporter family protein [Opitutaceae bacterium]